MKQTTAKKLLAILLSMLMLMSYIPIMGLVAFAKIESKADSPIYIGVPETIYMKPSTSASKEAQYFIQNTINTSTGTISTSTEYPTKGTVTFSCADAEKVYVSVSEVTVKGTIENLTNTNGVDVSSGGEYSWAIDSLTKKSGVSAGDTAQLTWNFHVTMKNGESEVYHAYTTLYSPYISPVGAAVEVHDQTSYIGSVAWISGIHDADTNTISTSSAKHQGIYFAKLSNRSLVPLINGVDPSDNTGNDNMNQYVSASKDDNTAPYSTIAYGIQNEGHDIDGMSEVSPIGYLTVDRSRYNNLEQIPNFNVGFLVSDGNLKDNTQAWWYFSDYTGVDDSMVIIEAWDKNTVLGNGANKYWIETVKPNWDSTGTFLGDNYYSKDNSSNSYGSGQHLFAEKLLYDGTVSEKIESSEKTYIFKGAVHTYYSSAGIDDESLNQSFVRLTVTPVDKTNLRELVFDVMKKGYNYSSVNSYTNNTSSNSTLISTLLSNAAKVLGDPTATASEITTAYNNLNTRVNGTTPKNGNATAYHVPVVKVLESNGDFANKYESKEDLEKEEYSVNTQQTVTYTANTYDHYTYKGYSNSKLDSLTDSDLITDTSVSKNFWDNLTNSSHNTTYFYYLADDSTITVDIGNGTQNTLELNPSSPTKEITGSYGGQFNIPAPTRENFEFMGWQITDASGAVLGTVGAEGEDNTIGILGADKSYNYTFTDKNVTLTARWRMLNENLNEDTVVLDFALPAKLSPLKTDSIDEKNESLNITAISATSEEPPQSSAELNAMFTDGKAITTVNGASGTFELTGNEIKYTPKTAIIGSDKIYYAVEYTNAVKEKSYAYSSVTIFPATSVYYEDNAGESGYGGENNSLIKYAPGQIAAGAPTDKVQHKSTTHSNVTTSHKVGEWLELGDKDYLNSISYEGGGIDSDYGYINIEAYTKNHSGNLYSMGSSHYVEVSPYNNPNKLYSGGEGGNWPYAQFSFSGTGFDVVSVIGYSTGTIEVDVYNGLPTDEGEPQGDPVSSMLVDTYYTYKEDNGEWIPNKDSTSALYQIPIINKSSLPYGSYTVRITPKYSTIFDHDDRGWYSFYLDAIRIYNPAGFENAETNAIYAKDGEISLQHTSIRPLILDAGSLNGEGDPNELHSGGWFINGAKTNGSYSDYVSMGPNNEAYLAKNQAIAFHIQTNIQEPWKNIAKIKVSAHAPSNESVSAPTLVFGTGNEMKKEEVINTAATLYYTIPAEYYNQENLWETAQDGSGAMVTKQPIIIANKGEGLLSLCDVKVTTSNTSLQIGVNNKIEFVVSKNSRKAAENIVIELAKRDVSKIGFFLPKTFSAVPEEEKVLKGSENEITVKASEDVARVTVNGNDAKFVEEKDGVKAWLYTFVTDKTYGTETFEVVTYSAAGNASDPITVTVDVQSRLEQFFDKLQGVIEIIVKIFDFFTGAN